MELIMVVDNPSEMLERCLTNLEVGVLHKVTPDLKAYIRKAIIQKKFYLTENNQTIRADLYAIGVGATFTLEDFIILLTDNAHVFYDDARISNDKVMRSTVNDIFTYLFGITYDEILEGA